MRLEAGRLVKKLVQSAVGGIMRTVAEETGRRGQTEDLRSRIIREMRAEELKLRVPVLKIMAGIQEED